MQVNMPFYESVEDALKDAVRALGGAKKVGSILFKDKPIDIASRYLNDCMNEGRAEKLEYTQMMLIFKMAREIEYHSPYIWFSQDIGYDSKPIIPAEQVDRLTTVIEQATKTLSLALTTLAKQQEATA